MTSSERYEQVIERQARNSGPETHIIRQVLACIDAYKTGEDFERDVQAKRAAIEKRMSRITRMALQLTTDH